MNIEVITIGNEILYGNIVDTNFVYLAKRLAEEGYGISRHTSIPDDPEVMEQCLREALHRSEIILTTGGLGPTLDDKTKEVIAQVFGKKLILNPAVKEELIGRYGPDYSWIDHQATVPVETEILQNRVGTAPGFLFKKDKNLCFVMPGVPLEMQTMFENEVLVRLKYVLQKRQKQIVKSLYLCHLPESNVDPYLRALDTQYPHIEKGIYPGYGVLSVEFKVKESPKAQQELQACVHTIEQAFGSYLFSQEDKSLSLAVHNTLTHHKKTLALAESCTGGFIASQLVQHAGASNYFLGGIVCYSDEMKKRSLGVKAETLRTHGAVSEETVKQMLEGAFALSGADYALAVSGVLGPSGGSQEKPIGTVWCGLGIRGEAPHIGKILAKGRAKRASMIEYTTNFMLGVLWRKVVFGINTL